MPKNLRVYERDHLYPQSISYYQKLIRLSPDRYPYVVNFWEVIVYKDDFFWWARDTRYLERAMRKWINSWVSNKKRLEDIIKKYRKDWNLVRKETSLLKQVKISNVDDITLLNIYKKAATLGLRHIIYAEYITDLFDDYFAPIFQEFLLKENSEITIEDLNTFCQPASLPAITKYRLEILKMTLNKAKKITNKFVEEYSWIKMGWDGKNEITEKEIKKELSQAKKISRKKGLKEKRKIENYENDIKKKRRELKKKYKIKNKKITTYFYLLDTLNVLHDFRKEIQMRCNQIIYRVLREIPKRFPLPYKDLMFYTVPEVENLLKEKKLINNKTIKVRQNGFVWLITKGKIKEYTGKKAAKELKRLILDPMKAQSAKDIKGVPASEGIAKGKAFVTRNAKEANKSIKRGEILVSPMTMPDYLPAMKRAAAVVTDDGGMTCHAAIVSRELGIPAVVGTKKATQIIKPGDKIEVDGNKGTVKITS